MSKMTATELFEELQAAAAPLKVNARTVFPVALVFHPDGETLSLESRSGTQHRHVPLKSLPLEDRRKLRTVLQDARGQLAVGMGLDP